MKKNYIKLLQERTGQLAIGRSTLRKQGAPGVIDTARSYLQKMNLKPLKNIDSEDKYQKFLNRHTNSLANSFPAGAKGNWGAARKAINIFMRDCLYNLYLCTEYSIQVLEPWLEVPLDKDVGKKLNENDPNLPKWKSIKYLKGEVSDKFQTSAQKLGEKEGVSRVHLDIKFWRNGIYTTNKAIN